MQQHNRTLIEDTLIASNQTFKNMLKKLGCSNEDTDDIISETTIKALRHWKQCKSDKPFPWLCSILFSTRIEILSAKRNRHVRNLVYGEAYDRALEATCFTPDYDTHILANEILTKIPSRQSKVLEKWSKGAVCASLIKVQVFRAKEISKRELKRVGIL